MKPHDFDYVRPTELDQVFDLIDQHGDDARILAGGQSLMPTLNMRLSAPALLIDINRIEALKGLSVEGDVLRIGALTRHVELERSAEVARHAPLLTKAIRHVAHPAVRNRGTIGGSLSLADPAAELPACTLALGATLVLRGRDGQRRVPADAFFLDLYETARGEKEVLEAVEVPVATSSDRFGFGELARRHGDFAMVGLAAAARMAGGTVERLRLAFFGIGNVPVLSSAADLAAARPLDADLVETLRGAVGETLDPTDNLQASAAMKKHLASVLVGRVLGDMME